LAPLPILPLLLLRCRAFAKDVPRPPDLAEQFSLALQEE